MSQRHFLKLEPPQPERLGCFIFPTPCLRRHPPNFSLLGFRASALNSHIPPRPLSGEELEERGERGSERGERGSGLGRVRGGGQARRPEKAGSKQGASRGQGKF